MRLILFDVDGTLIDSERVLIEAQRRTLARFGIPHPGRRAGLAVVGLSLPYAFRALLGPEADVEALSAAYREDFAALRADPAYAAPLYPGAADIIDALSARTDLVIGLATGKSRRGVAHFLEQHGWQGRFATIQTADTNPSKPDPGMVRAACEEVGISPEATTMVGDTTYDAEMARSAGASAIGVTWGYHAPDALVAAGAHVVITAFGELVDHIGE